MTRIGVPSVPPGSFQPPIPPGTYDQPALGPRTMATLAKGQRNVAITVLTDSTGRDDTATGSPTTGWVKRTASYLAALFPSYTVNYYTFTDDGAFGGSFGAATVLQTGAGSPPVLSVYNAAVGGKNANYFLAGRLKTTVTDIQPDLVLVSFGHNSTTELTQWWWPLLSLATEVLFVSTCELGLIAQNPEVSPSANTTQQQVRASDVYRVGKIVGAPVVDICQAFMDAGAATYVNSSDGVHPNSLGQALWATIVAKALVKGAETKAPNGSAVSGLAKAASNLATNGAMTITGGVLAGWTLHNLTVATDAVNFERSAQGYAAKLSAVAQTGYGAYASQTLDLAQCKGRQVTAIMRYFCPSGQTLDTTLARLGISDGVKDANHSLTLSDQQSRDGWSTALVSLQVDPASTAVELDLYVSTSSSASIPGTNITVQDVVVVLGPEPRGLTLGGVPGPAGAAGAPGTTNGPLSVTTHYNSSGSGAQLSVVTTATTLTALDTTNLITAPFVAPASGQVLVRLTGLFFGTGNGIWGLVDHGTANKRGRGVSITRGDALGTPASVAILVTGLTPGNTYQFDWAATAASTFNAGVGVGDSTNTYTANQGPATMEVWVA